MNISVELTLQNNDVIPLDYPLNSVEIDKQLHTFSIVYTAQWCTEFLLVHHLSTFVVKCVFHSSDLKHKNVFCFVIYIFQMLNDAK